MPITFVLTQNRIPEIMAVVTTGVKKEEEKAKHDIKERAQALAPVLSGFMHDNISETADGVISAAGYSGYVNYGTTFMSANPFFSNACGSVSATWLDRMLAIFRAL